MKIRKLALLATTIGALACASVSAATITFDFKTSGGVVTGSSYGNIRAYTDIGSGLTLTVTSFGLTGGSSSSRTWQTAYTGYYSGNGLGICDRYEGTDCGSPQHQADNKDRYDFFLLQFSSAVDPTSATIRSFSSSESLRDRDISYGVGSWTPADLLAMTSSQAGTMLGALTDDDYSSGSSALSVPFTSGFVSSLFFGPQYGSGAGANDFWKLQSLTVVTRDSKVPLPGTLALLGLGLAGFGFARRRA